MRRIIQDQVELSRINKWIAWGLLAAVFAVLLRRVLLMELDSFEFDDAFMFIRYAENILAGNGFTWNAGDPPIYGVTSILNTWVVTTAKWIFGGVAGNSGILVGSSMVFGLAFLAMLTGGLYRQVRSKQLHSRLILLLLTIPFLVLPLIFAFHISTGMGTMLSLFLHTTVIFATLRYAERACSDRLSLTVAAACAFLAYLARPDNAVAVLLFPALYFGLNGKYRHFIYLATATALLMAVDTAFKYYIFGDVLPLSFYAKRSGFTEGYTAKYFWNPVKYITEITAYLVPYILVLFFFARRKHAALLTSFLVPVLLTYAYFCGFDQIMGFHARFYFPFIPYVIVPAFLILDDHFTSVGTRAPDSISPNVLFRRFILLTAFLFLTVYSKYRFINMYESWAIREGSRNAVHVPDLEDRKYDREQSIRRISSLLKEFPDDLVFAATEHGYIAGDNPGKYILDLSGLHNPAIAKHGYSDSLMASSAPDLVWMPHQDLTVLHQSVRTGAYFTEHYEYITSVYAFGIGLRRDGPYYSQLHEMILDGAGQ